MAIQFDKYPFVLKFIQMSDSFTTEHLVQEFVYDEELLLKTDFEKIVKLKENIKLLICFFSDDPNAKVFMDGLDMLPADLIQEEEGVEYLPPQKDALVLFDNNDYPMIPGFYRIRVFANGKNYFSKIEITPTLIEKQEWEVMKNELEESINGLAQDLIRKNLGIINYDSEDTLIPSNLLYKFILISKFSSKIVSTLQDLSKTANYRIRRDYELVTAEKVKEIDNKTLSYQQMNPFKNKYKIPLKRINFDLPENRYTKKLIYDLQKLIHEFSLALTNYKKVLQTEIIDLETYKNSYKILEVKRKTLFELEKFEDKINRINFSIRKIEETEWYKEVSLNKDTTAVPPTLLVDSRYRVLYQLNRELKKKNISCILDSPYKYQWKRTDKLYEMWCFLQIHKALLSSPLNFVPIKGWIYDSNFESDQILIPVILPNTKITYVNDDITIYFIYDGTLPRNSAASNQTTNPLYSMNIHNKPDGRIDIYSKDVYVGSVLMDFKYRKPNQFWNYRAEPHKQPRNMQQLIAYSDNCRSTHLYGDYISAEKKRKTRPVSEVWAVYPKDHGKYKDQFFDDVGLRLIKVCPGKDNAHLRNIIKLNIDNVLRGFDDIISSYSVRKSIL